MPDTGNGLDPYIKKFLKYLEVERDVSVHTLRSYAKDLKDFAMYCPSDPGDIEMVDIRGFLSNQMIAGKAKSSVARELATLRSFF
jgi:integrase/recombinase XerC